MTQSIGGTAPALTPSGIAERVRGGASLVLYGDRLLESPYFFSVFVAAREKNVAHEVKLLDLDRGEQRSGGFAEKSLTARIPCIEHDGFVLSESLAILEYLDEVFAAPMHPRLLPEGVQARARARQLLGWLRSDLLPLREERPTSTMFYARATTPLSASGRAAADKLLRIADSVIPAGEGSLFGAWSIADADLCFMLHRLIVNGEPVPERVLRYASAQWQRPSVRAFVDQPRPAPQHRPQHPPKSTGFRCAWLVAIIGSGASFRLEPTAPPGRLNAAERERAPIDVTDHGRVNASLVIASMLLAAAISYVLVVLQPGLVRAIGAFWGRAIAPTNGSPQWAVPAIATGIAIGAASLALLVLSAFVSGVQRAPYLWLSPVLVGFSTLVLSRLHVQLPFAGVSLPLLSVLAGLLLLGGGALVQLHGIAYALSGSLLLLLPGSTLIAGHVVRAGSARLAWAAMDTSSALYLFVLLVTSIGVAIVAFVTRPFGAASSSLQSAARLQQQREQLAAAQEQARLLELHLGEAERRAELAEHELRARAFGRREDTADFVTLARPGLGRWLAPFGVALVLAAVPLAVYVGVYRPLTLRVAAQQAFAAEAARDHAEEIETLRKRLDAERASALAALTAERGKMAAALAAAGAAPVQADTPVVATAPAVEEKSAPPLARVAPARQAAAAQPKVLPNKVQAPAAAVHRVAKSAKNVSAARVVSAKRASAKKPAVAHAKPVEDSDDQDPAHALKETVNDDPIGGLDGM